MVPLDRFVSNCNKSASNWMRNIYYLLVALQYVKYWSITLLCAWREVSFKWQPKERWCFESKSWRPLFFEIYAKIVLFFKGCTYWDSLLFAGVGFSTKTPSLSWKSTLSFHFLHFQTCRSLLPIFRSQNIQIR